MILLGTPSAVEHHIPNPNHLDSHRINVNTLDFVEYLFFVSSHQRILRKLIEIVIYVH